MPWPLSSARSPGCTRVFAAHIDNSIRAFRATFTLLTASRAATIGRSGAGHINIFDGGIGFDSITGGNLNDSLRGGADSDKIDGGRGNDILYGAVLGQTSCSADPAATL
jgi:hypothetical protein